MKDEVSYIMSKCDQVRMPIDSPYLKAKLMIKSKRKSQTTRSSVDIKQRTHNAFEKKESQAEGSIEASKMNMNKNQVTIIPKGTKNLSESHFTFGYDTNQFKAPKQHGFDQDN